MRNIFVLLNLVTVTFLVVACGTMPTKTTSTLRVDEVSACSASSEDFAKDFLDDSTSIDKLTIAIEQKLSGTYFVNTKGSRNNAEIAAMAVFRVNGNNILELSPGETTKFFEACVNWQSNDAFTIVKAKMDAANPGDYQYFWAAGMLSEDGKGVKNRLHTLLVVPVRLEGNRQGFVAEIKDVDLQKPRLRSHNGTIHGPQK